jgi:hypothetical protein
VDSNQTIFNYDLTKDRANCLDKEYHGHFLSSVELKANDPMAKTLARSQPPSIFNPETLSLNLYPARSVTLKRALVLPNNYELFLAPWLADGSFSYAHDLVKQDWKKWFPGAHNAQHCPGSEHILNQISSKAFDRTLNLLDNTLKYVIKNHTDADNYWHWTFEWLPRLFILKRLSSVNAQLRMITFINIGTPFNEFQTNWLRIILGKQISILTISTPVLCNRLIWITPPFPAHHSTNVIDEIRQCIFQSQEFKEVPTAIKSPLRVYLLRGAARNGRRIKNEPELIGRLKDLGFVAIAMDDLSIFQQAKIFANAEIIVGPHGSAFVNIIYCNSACKVIELFGPGYLSGHDYSLATVCGLHWEFIEGQAVDNVPKFNSDFFIDCELLLKRLDDLGIV